jgi:hypothetical protein
MNFRTAAVLCGAFVVVAGCAVQGRPFERVQVPDGSAVIYVYRPYHYGSSALKPAVSCGEETARIGPGGYHAFVVPEGRTFCSVHNETADEVEIPASPRVHYIREEFGWGQLSGHPHLNPIDKDNAMTEIQQCCVQEEQQPPP